MSFQDKFLQTVSRESPALRREVYAAVTHPTYTREQKVNAVATSVIYHRQLQSNTGYSNGNSFTNYR